MLGYILAGFIIGPHTPPFSLITSEESINTLSEIGVILLMFSLGLEFSLRKLKKVGGTAVIAAVLEILVMGWVGYELGRAFRWNNTDSLFLGAMLAMSSTTVIIKVLNEMGRTKETFAQLIFGILIIEDILGIAMIALLSGIADRPTRCCITCGGQTDWRTATAHANWREHCRHRKKRTKHSQSWPRRRTSGRRPDRFVWKSISS